MSDRTLFGVFGTNDSGNYESYRENRSCIFIDAFRGESSEAKPPVVWQSPPN